MREKDGCLYNNIYIGGTVPILPIILPPIQPYITCTGRVKKLPNNFKFRKPPNCNYKHLTSFYNCTIR